MRLETGGRIKAKPGLVAGERSGDLTVVKYLGYSNDNPVTGKHLVKPTHWYEVECSCGNHEVTSQGMLKSTRKKTCCLECAADRKAKPQPKIIRDIDPDVPDFARMRW